MVAFSNSMLSKDTNQVGIKLKQGEDELLYVLDMLETKLFNTNAAQHNHLRLPIFLKYKQLINRASAPVVDDIYFSL